MKLEDRLPDLPTDGTDLTPPFYLFVAVPTLLGAAHHVDHVVRGNHVGWPLTPEVNPFTYSLAIYPLLAVSLYLSVTRRAEGRYWAGFFAAGAAMLAYFHVSPWAVEPPADVITPYESAVAGGLAFAVLLSLVGSTLVGAVYGAVLWRRGG